MNKKRFIPSIILILFLLAFALPVFAIPTADIDDDYTKLLIHADGADGSTSILDDSGKTTTVYGNAQLDTAQYKFGDASLLLDGSGDYITFADSDDFTLGSNSWTIDFWVRFNSLPASGGYTGFFGQYDPNGNYWYVGISNNSGTYAFDIYNKDVSFTVAVSKNANPQPVTGTWYHLAYIRDGNTFRIFQNGTSIGTVTDTDTFGEKNGPVRIGTFAASTFINGWMDEIRFSNGIARWTENFTPPTEYYYPTPTPTITYTPSNTPDPATPTFTPRPPYAEATAYIDSRITYGEMSVTVVTVLLCMVIVFFGLIALGLYIGQPRRRS